MPRFQRDTVPVHYPAWEEGEIIELRPRKRWDITTRAEEAAIPREVLAQARKMVTSGEDMEAVNDLLNASRSDVASLKALLAGMIASWTFRYPPTQEQEARGEPGDLVPITEDTVGDFDKEEMTFLVEEINKLGGGTEVPEGEGTTFPGSDTSARAGQPVPGAGEPTGDSRVQPGDARQGDNLGLRPDRAAAVRLAGSKPRRVG